MSSVKPELPDFSLGFVDAKYIYTFINLVLTDKPLLSDDVYLWLDRKGFKSKKAHNTLKLLVYASVVEPRGDKYRVTSVFLNAAKEKNQESTLKQFLLNSIPSDDLKVFTSNSYTSFPDALLWKPDHVSPFLVQLRDFLISLKLLEYDNEFLRASATFTKYLVEHKVVGALESVGDNIVSKEELLVALETKDALGDLAEKTALEFETVRIKKLKKEPLLISGDNVAAGYDIKSYENSKSKTYDRFIEVKYFNNQHFFISKNEIETAKLLGKSYWLYLVTIKNENQYRVEMINNPYVDVINSSAWVKDPVTFKISREVSKN